MKKRQAIINKSHYKKEKYSSYCVVQRVLLWDSTYKNKGKHKVPKYLAYPFYHHAIPWKYFILFEGKQRDVVFPFYMDQSLNPTIV